MIATRQARSIHHDEHRTKAGIFFAQQIADRAVNIHRAGGTAPYAHLVLNGTARDGIAGTARQHLGNKKQRYAARALWRIWKPRQNQMNDILGEVLLPPRTEYLLASNFVRAVSAWFCLRANKAEVGAALWLSQRHGAEHLSRHQT